MLPSSSDVTGITDIAGAARLHGEVGAIHKYFFFQNRYLSLPKLEKWLPGSGFILSEPPVASVPQQPPPPPTADSPLLSMMRAALGPSAFNSLRLLMLRQQAAYTQQLFDLWQLSQVQGLLVFEMQMPSDDDAGGGAFGPETACRREDSSGAPQLPVLGFPYSKAHGLLRSSLPAAEAHLRRIVRSLANLPKAMRGVGGEDRMDASACPPLPPLPCGLLRPLAPRLVSWGEEAPLLGGLVLLGDGEEGGGYGREDGDEGLSDVEDATVHKVRRHLPVYRRYMYVCTVCTEYW